MGEERKSLENMGVQIKDKPPGKKKQLLRNRWLLGTKSDMDSKIKRCKA